MHELREEPLVGEGARACAYASTQKYSHLHIHSVPIPLPHHRPPSKYHTSLHAMCRWGGRAVCMAEQQGCGEYLQPKCHAPRLAGPAYHPRRTEAVGTRESAPTDIGLIALHRQAQVSLLYTGGRASLVPEKRVLIHSDALCNYLTPSCVFVNVAGGDRALLGPEQPAALRHGMARDARLQRKPPPLAQTLLESILGSLVLLVL